MGGGPIVCASPESATEPQAAAAEKERRDEGFRRGSCVDPSLHPVWPSTKDSKTSRFVFGPPTTFVVGGSQVLGESVLARGKNLNLRCRAELRGGDLPGSGLAAATITTGGLLVPE